MPVKHLLKRCPFLLVRLVFVAIVFSTTVANPLAAEAKKVVISFDFQSKFDKGRYGEMVGEMIWKKLDRSKAFIVPESILDIRDFCASRKIQLAPDTPLDRVKSIVKNDFGAHIGIWGSVERVPGHDWDVYDFTLRCVDFSNYNKPEVVYEKIGVRTKVVSEIPHVYIKEMMDRLLDRTPEGPKGPNKLAEENWLKNPNLVEGGDFQSGSRGVPRGWESGGGQQREPLGKLVRWIPEEGNPKNRIIRFTFPKAIGDAEGVMYYSKYFPVEEGATYRFQARWRTNGANVKIFIKCSDEVGSKYSGRSRRSGEDAASQRREVYRSQQNLKGPPNVWNSKTEDFTPKHTKYTPKWGRVMLYAYLGEGVVDFDDIVIKQVLPAPAKKKTKTLRHSMSSGVTMKEMEENRRRGRSGRKEKK